MGHSHLSQVTGGDRQATKAELHIHAAGQVSKAESRTGRQSTAVS